MDIVYLISGITGILLMIYLIVVLLKPEIFL